MANPPPNTVHYTTTTTTSSGGFLDKIGKAFDAAAKEGEKLIYQASVEVDEFIWADSNARWERFQLHDPLLGEFSCRILSGNTSFKGSCFISFNYLCFNALLGSQNIFVKIPLSTVEYLVQAASVPSAIPNVPVIIQLQPNIKPTVIQLFTNDKLVHTLFDFHRYERAWSLLDYALRSVRARAAGNPAPNPPPNMPGASTPYPPQQH